MAGLANEKTLSTRIQVISRSKGGNAVRSAAYRAGEKLACERSGESWDYSRRHGVEAAFVMAPEGAGEWVHDRVQLWNRVETMERRKDAQLARELRVSLPVEATAAEREAIARETIQSEYVSRGMVADVAIHLYGQKWSHGRADTAEKVAEWESRGYRFLDEAAASEAAKGSQERPFVMVTTDRSGQPRDYRLFQPHFHAMLALRPLSADGLAFGKKTDVREDWNRFQGSDFDQVRARMTAIQNRVLEASGAEVRFDHRSYEERRVEAVEKAGEARAEGRIEEAVRFEARARAFTTAAQPYMGIAFKLKELTAAMSARVSQWVAVHHRNRLQDQIHAIEERDPVDFVAKAQRLLALTARSLGLKLETPREREEELGYER